MKIKITLKNGEKYEADSSTITGTDLNICICEYDEQKRPHLKTFSRNDISVFSVSDFDVEKFLEEN